MQRKRQSENGQAVMLVLLALSLCLLAAVGLAIDGSQLYNAKQSAQNAADSAVLAGMMSIFDGTNTGGNAFGVPPGGGANPPRYTCNANDKHTPCYYARQNGFDPANGDTVYADFWTIANSFALDPGVSFSNSGQDPVPMMRVTIVRPVSATLMRLVGASTANVTAQATAAIVTAIAPIPILVLHPTMNGALSVSGTGNQSKIRICGGPKRSIQVNSCAGTKSNISLTGGGSVACQSGNAFTWNGNPVIDLSKAGPLDTGGCTNGTGGDFGNFGFPVPNPGDPPLNLGTAGSYLDPQSPIADPLINVPEPAAPGAPQNACAENAGKSNCSDGGKGTVTCPATDPFGAAVSNCQVLYPGLYCTDKGCTSTQSMLSFIQNAGYLIFTPGIYYIQSGGIDWHAHATGQGQWIPPVGSLTYNSSCTNPSPDTGCGVMFYLAANKNGNAFAFGANAGDIDFEGADPGGTYQKIFIFTSREMPVAQTSNLGGNASYSVTGTIYNTNTPASILKSIGSGGTGNGVFQTFSFQGNPGQGTVDGEIIVDSLSFGGTPNVTMNLDPAKKIVRYIALVR